MFTVFESAACEENGEVLIRMRVRITEAAAVEHLRLVEEGLFAVRSL